MTEHRRPVRFALYLATGLSSCLALGACDTTRGAMDSVADASTAVWNTLSSPFNRGEDPSAPRDGSRERREDVEQWERIRGSNDPVVFQNFIERYPDSALIHLARRRLATLQPTQQAQAPASLVGGQPPAPPPQSPLGNKLPPVAPTGQFPVPWVLGRWALDCSSRSSGNGITYVQAEGGKVRVVRDDGSSAVYTVRRENDILVTEGNGLIYQDKIVSATELHSYAVKYKDQWNKVDLTYRKCD